MLVDKGIFDKDTFEREIKALLNKMTDTSPIWERFIKQRYWELSDDEFDNALAVTYPKLVEGKLHFVLYFDAFILFREFVKEGLLPKTIEEVKEELLDGMEKSAHKSEYMVVLDTYFLGSGISPDDHDAMEFINSIKRN